MKINITSKPSLCILSLVAGFLVCLTSVKGCDCGKPKITGMDHSHSEKHEVRDRPDSAKVTITEAPRHTFVKGKARRVDRGRWSADSSEKRDSALSPSSSAGIWCLDSVGFFAGADSTQIYPDTITVCHDLSTNELSVLFLQSFRERETSVHFVAHDSVTTIKDSTATTLEKKPGFFDDFFKLTGAGTVGIIIGVIATLIFVR